MARKNNLVSLNGKMNKCNAGLKTKKGAIEAKLKLKRQAKIKKYRGKLKWVGNLDEIRTDK